MLWICLVSLNDCCEFVLFCFVVAGELEVASAKNVLLYTGLSNKGQEEENSLCGLLFVTNFKLSFLTNENDEVAYFFLSSFETQSQGQMDKHLFCSFFSPQDNMYQENVFLQRNDVTLQNIDQIYQIVNRKKRLVSPYSKIDPKLEGLHIVCKVWNPVGVITGQIFCN